MNCKVFFKKLNIILFFTIAIFFLQNKSTECNNIKNITKLIAKTCIKKSIWVITAALAVTPPLLYLLHTNVGLPYKNISHPWNNEFTAERRTINGDCYYHISRKEPIKTDSKNAIFVHLHGYGDHPLALACSQDAKLFPSNEYFAICFEEASTNKLFKSNFGQEGDIKTILTILRYISKNYTSIKFIAHSRGAAALINSISILNRADHELLKLLDINEEERITLLRKIKNGAIVLKAPMIHTKTLINHTSGKFFGTIVEKCILGPLTAFRYSPRGPQAINSLNAWGYLSIPTLICFPENDQFLSDTMNDEFIKKYMRVNGQQNSYTYTYKGDHAGWSDDTFAQLIPYFLTHKTIII